MTKNEKQPGSSQLISVLVILVVWLRYLDPLYGGRKRILWTGPDLSTSQWNIATFPVPARTPDIQWLQVRNYNTP